MALLECGRWFYIAFDLQIYYPYVHVCLKLVPKSETWCFDSWLTLSLRIECNFPLATSDIQMMSEAKFYS